MQIVKSQCRNAIESRTGKRRRPDAFLTVVEPGSCKLSLRYLKILANTALQRNQGHLTNFACRRAVPNQIAKDY